MQKIEQKGTKVTKKRRGGLFSKMKGLAQKPHGRALFESGKVVSDQPARNCPV